MQQRLAVVWRPCESKVCLIVLRSHTGGARGAGRAGAWRTHTDAMREHVRERTDTRHTPLSSLASRTLLVSVNLNMAGPQPTRISSRAAGRPSRRPGVPYRTVSTRNPQPGKGKGKVVDSASDSGGPGPYAYLYGVYRNYGFRALKYAQTAPIADNPFTARANPRLAPWSYTPVLPDPLSPSRPRLITRAHAKDALKSCSLARV